jgi:hypothetical protein
MPGASLANSRLRACAAPGMPLNLLLRINLALYLVKRAAATASSWIELTAQLAAEIEAAPARQAFLEGCRSGTTTSFPARP